MTSTAQAKQVPADDLPDFLIGHRVVGVDRDTNTLHLDNGTTLEFQAHNESCCSSIDLTKLSTTDHVITNCTVEDNEDETGGEGDYRAWIHVVTEAGELNVAEAEGDASNGYYLHGFALDVTVTGPPAHIVIQEEP